MYRKSIAQRKEAEKTSVASCVWICVNCWELVLGHESKMEHVNARHLLTSSLADSEPATQDNFIKLCRIYGRINPEETHIVLLYVPQCVREAIRNGLREQLHVTERRIERERDLVKGLATQLYRAQKLN